MHAPDTGAQKQKEQAAAERARPAALDRRTGFGSGSTSIGHAGAQSAYSRRTDDVYYAEVVGSLTHEYAVVLLVILCSVDTYYQHGYYSIVGYNLLESLSVDFAKRKKSHQPNTMQSSASRRHRRSLCDRNSEE